MHIIIGFLFVCLVLDFDLIVFTLNLTMFTFLLCSLHIHTTWFSSDFHVIEMWKQTIVEYIKLSLCVSSISYAFPFHCHSDKLQSLQSCMHNLNMQKKEEFYVMLSLPFSYLVSSLTEWKFGLSFRSENSENYKNLLGRSLYSIL